MSRPAWSIKQVPGQPGLHTEKPCLEKGGSELSNSRHGAARYDQHVSVEDQGFKVILKDVKARPGCRRPSVKATKAKVRESPQVARVCLGPMALFFYVHNFALLFSQLKIKSTHAI